MPCFILDSEMESFPLAVVSQIFRRLGAGTAAFLLAATSLAAPLQQWTTPFDGATPLQRGPDLHFSRQPRTGLVIDINPHDAHQHFIGVGAGLTDASAWLIAQRLSGQARTDLLRELFAAEQGLGLHLLRVTIGGSDFSQRQYSLDDTEGNVPDPTLAHYAEAPETLQVRDLLQSIHQLNPDLRIIASPWSAPAWMKSSHSLIGGYLLPEYHAAFADYLLRFAEGYAAAGVPLYALTIQNEPAYEARDYASMRFDAEDRARFIAKALGPRLAAQPHPPQLLEWDHNWSMPGSPLAVLAHPDAARYIAGIAWHCYGGLPPAQDWVQAVAPSKDVYITECSSGDWQREWPDTFRSMLGTVLIEGIRHGARGVLLWNLALDEHRGPHSGGCPTCRAVVTLDAQGHVERHAEYYALAHIGRFVQPNALVIGSTSNPSGIRSVAFLNPDGQTLTVVLQNMSDHALDFAVRVGAQSTALSLAAGAVTTLVGRP